MMHRTPSDQERHDASMVSPNRANELAVERATAEKPRMLTRSPSKAEGRLLPKDGLKCSPRATIRQGASRGGHMNMAIRSLSPQVAFDNLPARARGLHPASRVVVER
jgi:hypothetical protein